MPSMNSDGFEMYRARVNQESGSPQTVAPVPRCWPSGTPTMGAPEPEANGHRPHACTVVARHRVGGSSGATRPPPGPGEPRCGMLSARLAFAARS
jgi:hypothetical protein